MASAAIRMTQPSAARLNQFTAVPPCPCSAMKVPGAKTKGPASPPGRRSTRARGTLAFDDHGEGDDQGVDDQRLDESEADDHRASNGGAGARVAGDAFDRRRDGLPLSKGS